MALGDSIVAVWPHMEKELAKDAPNSEAEWRAYRSKLSSLANDMFSRAEGEGRDLTEQEAQAGQEIATLMAYAADHIRELRGEYAGSGAHKPTPNNSSFSDEDDNAFRIFNRDESIMEGIPLAQRSKEKSDSKGVSIGSLVRAMALGRNHKSVSEQAALTIGAATDSLGGVTVPTYVTRQYIDMLRAKNRAIQAGATTAMIEGKTVIAKVVKDPTAGWRAENEAVTKSDISFEKAELNPKSLAVIVVVSRELLEDSVNIDQVLSNSLAECMASALDTAVFYGAGGDKEPQGISNVTGILEITMGENGAPVANYSPLIKSLAKLAENNANDATAAIMNPRTYFEFADLCDTTGQPLRKPEALTNLNLLHTNKVPTNETQGTATDATSIITGNFTDVIIGMRTDFRLELLRELYAENYQYGFLASLRADVAVANPESFCVVKGITPKTAA
ncbi:phage major capsid protein [Vibrio vulnificus]|nr:phage major capsid protein [Vibrio vulnificus]